MEEVRILPAWLALHAVFEMPITADAFDAFHSHGYQDPGGGTIINRG
jgi:hypothetical protein